MKPKVTVYVPCHDYGRFLAQAVDSVRRQSYDDWELIIVDDGSTDETASVTDGFRAGLGDRLRVLRHSPARGLRACANLALEAARGDYVMRLDADDFLDESALLVLATYLDRHPDVGLVYPNYTYVDEQGALLGVELRKRIGEEVALLDLPAHGAGTMVRKRVLKSVGGYSEAYDAQDGVELWLKVIRRYGVANVFTPLFFYRQHAASLSRDADRILAARQRIKRALVDRHDGPVKPRVGVVIPARNTTGALRGIVLTPVAGRPLIEYTVEAARQAGPWETIFVTTDDAEVAEHCRRLGVAAGLRPPRLSETRAHLSEVTDDAVRRLERDEALYVDIVVVLSVHCPLRRPEHIRQAVDTLVLYDTDSVVSVYEDYDLHFVHGRDGLEPLNRGMLQRLRLEREALYVDNGAIKTLWRDVLSPSDLYGRRVGHVVMPWRESFQIKSPFDAWLIGEIITRGDPACYSSPKSG
jgi:CMP-N-acetylneuraminic acid synthetase